MSSAPITKKLRLLPGYRALVLNAPPGYLDQLGELPENVTLEAEPAGTFDFVHLFARDRAELERFWPAVLGALRYDGVLWISYPKRSSKVESDLTRDEGWVIVGKAGLRPVTQVSVDETWSAVRFRPVERVKAKK